MPAATTDKRRRLNKAKIWLQPESNHFPFGGISIALIEEGLTGIKDAGGARYYRNPDGTMTMVMNNLKDGNDPLSHTFKKKEWGVVRRKKNKSV